MSSVQQINRSQIVGETAAVDLVLAYLKDGLDPSAVTLPVRAERARDYMRQQLEGLLYDAVLADPSFSLHRRAVMGPAGREWLRAAPMSGDVAEAVLELARDGGDAAFRRMSDDEVTMVLALSTAARGVAVWGVAGTIERLQRSRAVVSRP
ncbi:hypothetical protein ACFV6U_37260 [Streptomyces sp. NPDC059810]|uniref:hypothetical protein n=1 Tax=Streptomyces sp. NPDC059810 TaxID=3346956 RepID=UPI0036595619